MTTEPVPSPSFLDLYRRYAEFLPRWFRYLRLCDRDAADAAQDVWAEVGKNLELIPATPREAQLALFKLAARVADRLRQRAAREAARLDDTRAPDELPPEGDIEEQAAEALALMEALDALDPQTRRLVVASRIYDRTDRDIAEEEGLTPSSVQSRVWRTCSELWRRIRGHNDEEKDRRRGALLLPGLLAIRPEFKAAMCAIWEAEGRLPSFGGPGGPGGPGEPPHPPAPPPPSLPRVPATPSVLSMGPVGVLLALLILVVVVVVAPAGLVMVTLQLDDDKPHQACAGLDVPPMVFALDPTGAAPPPRSHPTEAPTPSSPRSANSTSASSVSPSGTLSPEALKRLRATKPPLKRGRE
ncbi:sigma factor-like helix-turn-helix DNA-binding protein [Polyangium sorediatum]|uniref:Sigma factor-like helix-turn-helix DNA-binding protein n=1 Tax=Polyangium sorediatum TaxID=889274 RepID=A0ABT6NKG2_9BACT|nr:sigma factor-like helix-turn-helix DNA-binding protein [Polyangium sorediatum]MDI1428793.1 sigma factor-like helix-turn-helix DNA-binding protein [Polyangium sorediatum]